MATEAEHLELSIAGMTCASCASRVEKRLNGLAGVAAAVNFATEKATVDFDPAAVDRADLVDADLSGATLSGANLGSAEDLTAELREPALVDRAAALDRAAIRRTAERRFSAERMVDDYLAVYRRLVTPSAR